MAAIMLLQVWQRVMFLQGGAVISEKIARTLLERGLTQACIGSDLKLLRYSCICCSAAVFPTVSPPCAVTSAVRARFALLLVGTVDTTAAAGPRFLHAAHYSLRARCVCRSSACPAVFTLRHPLHSLPTLSAHLPPTRRPIPRDPFSTRPACIMPFCS